MTPKKTFKNVINLEERKKIKNSSIDLLNAENNLLIAIVTFIHKKDETFSFEIRGIYEIIKDMELSELHELLSSGDNPYYDRFKAMSLYAQEHVFMNLKIKLMLEVTEPNF